eukprot:CAMPEP_0180025308 /NCGR_PEP_ID=MMETSP0984-20121128/24561_1 /TAXON_ID=483367 /ORGANISM="non described non described, Strain CCMP 2436" /LENGTH=143 /DNA_ID=CAMNT_0021949881 /DNA_START=165 /DNA_END=597 /DNA_ORIENTATION=+
MAPSRRVSESDAATMNLVGPTGPARSWTLATCYRSKRTSVASTMAPLRRVSESDAAIMNLVPLNGSDRLDRGICEATLGGGGKRLVYNEGMMTESVCSGNDSVYTVWECFTFASSSATSASTTITTTTTTTQFEQPFPRKNVF